MIEIAHLTKRYGPARVLDDVSFTAEPGRVTGFLGPNGAGKSTTLRVLCGLATASSGTATVAGRRLRGVPNPGRTVGVLLDASAQHAGRSGREVLALSTRLMGLPSSRVAACLDRVGLTAAEADSRTRTYSLGMRQRLGLAHALLGEPQVLVLDEPANGLDPTGIRWMRDLLRSFADDGGTVLLSSHLLREVEVIADDLVLIGRGRVLAKGTAQDLLSAPGAEVRSLDDGTLARTLIAGGNDVRPLADGGLSTSASAEDVGRHALDAGVVLTELRPTRTAGLEDLFFALTAGSDRDEVTA
ncbi:ATP-binding cassette domain-containing protein [Cellulomonas sp. RIT-PI-Y]|uniref:ABC transporter ATP-binding protein n=1 Tax=Cellulomonas sp. RIT-PI-Y TaxID=3035297 RepID=UPI0021D7FEAF|nr:ATP-binding cassette domain-containing protein [Cellulomonas sp. RIT-PI-Y]